ncbi:hypothetical protein [Pseudarthrobacter sp. efr-133-R2A-89]|uniref:hypothetical protein n=1 Tax=Pseudarthrobacter sp. efr-133-R2A-89 TaxID=3040302 RepID=UPI002553C032|nr:hypothetical protein [Pseudarthrobacter sp. efr-133-R2A-89]
MTELTEPDNVPAQPAPEWPQADGQDIPDPHVAQSLYRLQEIPLLPTAGHEDLYNRLHDELLAALNTDPTDAPAANAPAGGGA